MIKIDKGVPIPKPSLRGAKLYPLRNMMIGDSFLVDNPALRSGIYSNAKNVGIKITVRQEGKKLRVWRTA